MAKHIPYEENHKTIDGVLYKKCNRHYLYFPENNPWLVCNDENFYKNSKNSVDGLNPWCKKCAVIKSGNQIKVNPKKHREQHKKYEQTLKWREYSKRNHEDQKENRSQYRKENKEKMIGYAKKHRKHDITESEWQACQNAFNNCCAYCGKSFQEQYEQNKQQFHREHVDDQGYNDLRNCVPSCTNCNSTKHKSTIDELMQYHYINDFTLNRYNFIIWWITEGYKQYIEDKPPYRILRKKNTNDNLYHYELWTVDEKRNIIESVFKAITKKEIEQYISNIQSISV